MTNDDNFLTPPFHSFPIYITSNYRHFVILLIIFNVYAGELDDDDRHLA